MQEDEPAREEPEPEKIEPVRAEDKRKNLMPKYAKFLKKIMSNKRRLEDLGLVTLNEECSTILQNKLPVALQGDERELSNEQLLEQLAYLLASEPSRSTDPFVSLDKSDVQKVKPSIEDPLVLELKELPKHLSYAYLDKAKRLPVIITADLTPEEREMTLLSLKKYLMAIAYKIMDIPGINPSFCSHKILMEDSFRPVVQPQRRLNPNMKKVVKNELMGYFQIPIAPDDQEKTTFTCPYGTFAYRRMPFGLCNAPTTFQRCMMAIFHDMIEKSMEVFMDDFFVLEGIVLGHKISHAGMEVDRAKVETISK
eukprot:XP_015584063.1 uncharacterized protein LOC107262498 [Ricinus communis]